MDRWTDFYARLFNFREIRYFDIEGRKTGLLSRALTSPCGKIRIPINESQDDKSQIEEYLREYRGEGIQHIALATADIYATVDMLRGHGVEFQDTPDTYYEGVDARVPGHGEPLEELQKAAHPDRRQSAEGRGSAVADFHAATSSARSSSRSSSARATRASARAISRRCSSRSSWIRNGGASI